MRLSEAIRLGSTMRPQSYGDIFAEDESGTCALGAAIDALGGKSAMRPAKPGEITGSGRHTGPVPEGTPVFEIPAEWQPLFNVRSECPLCSNGMCGNGRRADGEMDLRRMIAHLNDDHRWTREAIADWVEQREFELGLIAKPEQEAAQEVAAKEVVID